MIIVYRPSDRIKLVIDDITFTIRPLSFYEKSLINAKYIKQKSGETEIDSFNMQLETIRRSLCDFHSESIFLSDGTKFEVKKDSLGVIEDESLEVILSIPNIGNKLILAIAKFYQNNSDPELDGVTFTLVDAKKN